MSGEHRELTDRPFLLPQMTEEASISSVGKALEKLVAQDQHLENVSERDQKEECSEIWHTIFWRQKSDGNWCAQLIHLLGRKCDRISNLPKPNNVLLVTKCCGQYSHPKFSRIVSLKEWLASSLATSQNRSAPIPRA
jgi:hypothetical protein